MKQYLRVFLQSTKNAFSYLLAYRADFAIKVFLGAGWSLTWIGFMSIFFAHTDSFNGWGKAEMILLISSFEFLSLTGIFGNNIYSLESNIRHGNFDFTIIRPIDSQFLATFERPDLSNAIFFVSYQIPLMILLFTSDIQIFWSHLPLYFFLILLANGLFFAIVTIIASINFWKQRMDNLQELTWAILEFGKYPITIFPKKVQIFFHSVIPLAFLGFVPASVLIGNISWVMVGIALFITLFFLVLSRVIWNFAIKKYTSASS